jgi:hypothetical protein
LEQSYERRTRQTTMNEDLKAIAIEAGAPDDVLSELWFSVFCMRFADLVITAMENEDK